MRKRRILLIEPKYKNKYPPIGLMKIATYHKILGDRVQFFKGDLKDLVLDEMTEKCIKKLRRIDKERDWKQDFEIIREYIRTRKKAVEEKLQLHETNYATLVHNCIYSFAYTYYKKDYKNFPKWDRVYVTTLFTFYWKITVEAIHYAKHLTKKAEQIKVGGVLASLLHKELEFETGIKPYQGLLDKPNMLDPEHPKAKGLIVDNLSLDYSILDEIDYQYPTGSAYFTFMTKGCTRKCAFCSVPILEPIYKPKIDTIDKFAAIKEQFGEQQHLLLMDNNVLASPKFPEVIQEIKDMGFVKGAMYIEPNQLDIAIKNLKEKINDKAYIRRSYRLIHELIPRLKGEIQQEYYNILDQYKIIKLNTTTKQNLLYAYKKIKDIYEKYRRKAPKQRFVDFNQGTDARYVTDEYMKLMSEIPIYPLRIAFDYWGMKKKYVEAIHLASKYGINRLSNYLLFNFKDRPEDLYNRMQINVELSEELNIHIYSFPMKFIPLFGEDAKHRQYIGKFWNKKFIRAIQSISNVTRGIVPPGRSFFEKAYGENIDEYFKILYMPETYIIYRSFFENEKIGLTQQWSSLFNALTEKEKSIAFPIIETNEFKDYYKKTSNKKILQLLKHYTIKRDDVKDAKKKNLDFTSTKAYFDQLIKNDQFKDLTLTYDFEEETITKQQVAEI